MTYTASNIRNKIFRLEKELQAARQELENLECRCAHQWEATVYDPIVTPGGYDPGDPPGTMGVDRRLPSYYSGSETPRWRRTCSVCGKTEITTRTDEHTTVTKTPRF